MNYDGGLSASDVALLTGNGRNDNNGFGDGNGWWIIIFLIFAFMGWGGNGFGNRGNGSQGGVASDYVLASDFAQLSRQLDNGFDRVVTGVTQVNQGLCDGFYAMNTGMLNGFSGIQSTLCTGFGGINNAITSQGYESRLGTQQLSSQLSDCCCTVRQELSNGFCGVNRSIDGVNYNMAMNTNALQNAMCNNTRDIIEANNANFRALHDEIVANRIEDKNAQITAQQNEINSLRLAASQAKQNAYLVDQLGTKCPSAAYIVPNPNCCYNYQVTQGCGCNGCGNY